MQPEVRPRPPLALAPAGTAVVAIRATGREPLRAALRRMSASPELIAVVGRVVVLDAGSTPAATLLHEAARLPVGLLRVVRRAGAARPEALAMLLAEAVDESGASHVLVLDDVALADPGVLRSAIDAATRSRASDVIGLRSPAAATTGPVSWWAAVLPLDAVRAIGSTLPEAGEAALAELVLRADAAGFRSTVLPATGPVRVVPEADTLLLALLHEPASARRLLAAGASLDLLDHLAGRSAAVSARRAALLGLLGGPEGASVSSASPRLRLWATWSALRRRYRDGAVMRASADAWTLRLLGAEVNDGWQGGERAEAAGRPAGLRLPAWPTTRRGTSAA